MKIATEIGWAHKEGGARRVAISILQEMIKLRPQNEYIVFSNCRQSKLEGLPIIQKELRCPSYMSQNIWDQVIFPHIAVPIAIKKVRPDVIHYTNNMMSFWDTKIPSIVTIHDMTPFILPDSFTYLHGAYHRAYFQFAVKKAVRIITISENSKNDICRILKVKEKKVVVIPNASFLAGQGDVIEYVDLENTLGVKLPFILYVGAIHPRKNVGRIIEAFSQLKQKNKIPHKLVIAGSLRWQFDRTLKCDGFDIVKDDIIFTGRVSDSVLINLYKQCAVFVYPSLYEGFGLPVLEAMSAGAPVVTSNTSALPEVAGDAAILVNPEDVGEIASAILRIINDTTLADELRRMGFERSAKFSWTNTAQRLLDVLETVS